MHVGTNVEKNMPAAGFWYGILAYTTWGILPMYWKLLEMIPAAEILVHRIFWSFVFTSLFLFLTDGRQTLLKVMANRKKLLLFFCVA